jgi:hypothetical protein
MSESMHNRTVEAKVFFLCKQAGGHLAGISILRATPSWNWGWIHVCISILYSLMIILTQKLLTKLIRHSVSNTWQMKIKPIYTNTLCKRVLQHSRLIGRYSYYEWGLINKRSAVFAPSRSKFGISKCCPNNYIFYNKIPDTNP